MDYKKLERVIIVAYIKLCAVMMIIYAAVVAFVMKWSEITEFVTGKVNWIKEKLTFKSK